MKIKFSAPKIKNLKPGIKSKEYFDKGRDHGAGAFGIRVSPKGKKAWFVMYTNKDKEVTRFALGVYPDKSLHDARIEADNTMADVRKGNDPQQKRVDYKTSETFSDLWETYLESPRAKKKTDSTLKTERQKYEKILKPVFGEMKVQDIKKKDLVRVMDKMATTAPVNANRLHSLLSMLFKKFAVGKGWIELNPMSEVEKPGGPEKKRQRFLSDSEIKTLWPELPPYFQLILLTCQRPGEVLAARHDEMENGDWIIPEEKSKTDQINTVPLSPEARSSMPEQERGSGYLFPSNSATGHLQYTAKARKAIQEKTGVKDWTAHDLRRTGRTLLARLKVPHHIAERILNHAVGPMEETYNMYDYLDEKRIALQKLSDELGRITGGPGILTRSNS